MASDARASPDAGLELENIAVGPYCVFDDFRLPPSPQPSRLPGPARAAAAPTVLGMEDPLMAAHYPFATMRAPWLSAVQDGMSNWNDWMQYDPTVVTHSAHSLGPKPSQEGPSPFLRHQQSPSPPLPPSDTSTTAAPMYSHANTVPFTFGQGADISPAFDFSTNALSSPLTGDLPPQNALYQPPPMWQQQPQSQQQQQQLEQQQQQAPPPPPPQQQQSQSQSQHLSETALFAPDAYAPPGFAAPLSQPPPTSTTSLHHSPSSLNNARTSPPSLHSSPEPIVRVKKRKSTSDDEEFEAAQPGKREKGQPPKKTAHNMIEKRYRTNLNDKIAALRDSVPSLRVMSRPNGTEEDDDPEDLEGLTPAHKLNKATVLSKATEYIRHLEKRAKRMQDELMAMQGRIESYEKMSIAGPMSHHSNHVSASSDGRYHEDPFSPTNAMSIHGSAQGMIPVPENIAALQRGLAPQAHYAPAYPQYANMGRPNVAPPMVSGRRNSAMMGKLMVGSLAGLMVLEGLIEHEQSPGQSADHGLFALPIQLIRFLVPQVSIAASTAQIPLAKLLLVFGAFFYLVAPLLAPASKPQKKTMAPLHLKAAPSPASPVEVRRKAWLTAIQSVWVPRHNFLLEVAALALKSVKLSARKLIGWPGYAYLTGLTQEQESTRIKAWEIALDAQLIGGDAEISKSRLLLTLMASGTLPDTPARLMLKALHIRVLLWDVGKTRLGSWSVVDTLSAKMARSYWNMARSEHQIAANLVANQVHTVDPLPEHLAALIEKECDEVLMPAIVQRAHDLAWNRISDDDVVADTSMDGAIKDFAICSPLDALAAWYSTTLLRKGLANTLAVKSTYPRECVISDLDIALRSAPPESQAQLRSLVAQAVILDNDRTAHIISSLEALPSDTPSVDSGIMNLVGEGFVAEDIQQALTLAKCLSLVESSSFAARRRAVVVINNICLPEVTTTLLSFVAAHKVLTRFMRDPSLQAETSFGLERIASSLRMWVGHETGRRSGLSNKIRGIIVESCLDASKTLVGLDGDKRDQDIDDGYVSSSVKDD